MVRRSKPKGQKGFVKKSTESHASLNVTSGGYEAPTVGYEDVLNLHGTTKAAAEFGKVNTRLARYVSVQSWSGAMITGRAMKTCWVTTQPCECSSRLRKQKMLLR